MAPEYLKAVRERRIAAQTLQPRAPDPVADAIEALEAGIIQLDGQTAILLARLALQEIRTRGAQP